MLGCAVLIKQHGASFAVAGIGIIFYDTFANTRSMKDSITRIIIFIIGVSLPYLLTCMAFILSGNFKNFIYWTFIHAREYVGLLTLSQGIDHFKGFFGDIWSKIWTIWSLAGIGIIYCVINIKKINLIVICSYFHSYRFLLFVPAFIFDLIILFYFSPLYHC